MKNSYKTIVLSDLHLGSPASNTKELVGFLKTVRCQNLILNGNIIDWWQLKKHGIWKKKYTHFFKQILKMMEKDNTSVTYIRGNNDYLIDHILPLQIGNFEIKQEMVYRSFGRRFYVMHGDIIKVISPGSRWLLSFGQLGYRMLLKINHLYNSNKQNIFSSSLIKGDVALNFKKDNFSLRNYETQLAQIAKMNGCDGIICGHIHQPAIKTISDIDYMNSGDWIGSLSALVEDFNGEWSLVFYTETQPMTNSPDKMIEEENDLFIEENYIAKFIYAIKPTGS